MSKSKLSSRTVAAAWILLFIAGAAVYLSSRNGEAEPPPPPAEVSTIQSEWKPQLQKAINQPGATRRKQALAELAERLLDESPSAATDLVKTSFKTADEKQHAYHFVTPLATGFGKKQPQVAASWATTLPAPHNMTACAAVLRQWLSTNAAEASMWALTIENPDIRQVMIQITAEHYDNSTDLAAGGNWAQALSKRPEASQNSTIIARLWGQSVTDTKPVLQWANSLQDHGARDQAIIALVHVINERDPEQAQAFLNTLPEDSFVRDHVMRDLKHGVR